MCDGGERMPISESRKAANTKWDQKNLTRMSLAVRNDLREKLLEHSSETGESINGTINRILRDYFKLPA